MPGVGATLREARERKGLTLKEVSTATKIPPHTLELIERNDLDQLPGGIFVRGFLRSYAAEVGLDPDAVVSEYLQQLPGEDPTQGATAEAERGAAVELDQETEFVGRQHIASVVLKLVLISLPLAMAIVYLTSRGRAVPVDLPEPAPEPPGVETAVPQPPAAVPGPGSGVAAVPSAQEAEPPVTIEIAPNAPCWVQLTVDGTLAVSRVIEPGEREAHRFQRDALLHVGDAAACAVLFDGRPARPLGREKQVRQLRITRANYSSLLP